MTIEIIVTDRNLNVLAPIGMWTSIDVTLRFNEPASGQLIVPISPAVTALLAPGNRIAIKRDLAWFVAGPIERPGKQRFTADGERTYTVTFTDDLALITGRRVYPDPANAITAQGAAQRTFTATNGEDVLQTLVDENAGPGALVARRIPQLIIATDAGVGGNVTTAHRLDPLGDAMRSVALAAGGLGFRTAQVGSNIEYQVYEPQDLTNDVVFSHGLGNLIEYTYDPEAPRATVALVGDGSGTGTGRVFRERVSAEAATWWRLETLVDRRDTTTTAVLDAAGDEELAEQAATASLSAICIETPSQKFGTHLRLGDLTSVVLLSNDIVADIVRAVRLVATPQAGQLLTLLVGTQSATTDRQWLALVNKLRRDVDRLQAI